MECGISEGDIDLINWWRKVEEAQGRKPGLSIQDHYTQVAQLKSSKLRFSRAIEMACCNTNTDQRQSQRLPERKRGGESQG
jgi:hypothetical protein